MSSWKELLKAHEQMGNSHMRADPCLYYNGSHDILAVWLSQIDDNLFLGFVNGTMPKKIDCMEEGEMKVCVECKIVCYQAERSLKMMQLVYIQSIEDEFEIPGSHHSVTPTLLVTIFMK